MYGGGWIVEIWFVIWWFVWWGLRFGCWWGVEVVDGGGVGYVCVVVEVSDWFVDEIFVFDEGGVGDVDVVWFLFDVDRGAG